MHNFRLRESPRLLLASLGIGLAVPLVVASVVVRNTELQSGRSYSIILFVGVVGFAVAASFAKAILSARFPASFLRDDALAEYLVPSWSKKWDVTILGKYIDPSEQRVFARLVATGRWEFSAVPSVRKKGITIELKGKAVTDKDVASLSRLRTIHAIVLADCHVTDTGLSHLTRLASLECLVLSRTSITDGGLIHLGALPKLRTLDVVGTSVNDSALRAAGLFDKRFSLAPIEKEASAERAAAPIDAVPVSVEIVQ